MAFKKTKQKLIFLLISLSRWIIAPLYHAISVNMHSRGSAKHLSYGHGCFVHINSVLI